MVLVVRRGKSKQKTLKTTILIRTRGKFPLLFIGIGVKVSVG